MKELLALDDWRSGVEKAMSDIRRMRIQSKVNNIMARHAPRLPDKFLVGEKEWQSLEPLADMEKKVEILDYLFDPGEYAAMLRLRYRKEGQLGRWSLQYISNLKISSAGFQQESNVVFVGSEQAKALMQRSDWRSISLARWRKVRYSIGSGDITEAIDLSNRDGRTWRYVRNDKTANELGLKKISRLPISLIGK
jgi:hypothetical protein